MTLIADSRSPGVNTPANSASGAPSGASSSATRLVELILIVGGICLAWLGVMLRSGQL